MACIAFKSVPKRVYAILPFSMIAKGDEKGNLTAKALEMSLKYKFVTPLTSMVVTKPEDNEEKEAVADKPLEGTEDLLKK